MTKENILFAIIGLLAGFMVGFFFTNSVNQSALTTPTQTTAASNQQLGNLPAGHPSVPGGGGGGAGPEVQAAIDRATQNPNDFDAQLKAAELYYQIQRFDDAIGFLQKASELQPENYQVMVTLANVNFDAGRYDEAEKKYARALAKKPDDLNVRTDLGLTFMFRNPPDNDRAIQEFKRVLEADARDRRAHV